MRVIRYIFQIVLLWLLVVPTLSQAVISDPKFTKCGLFPSALNTWETIEQGNGIVVKDADTIYLDGYTGKKDIFCEVGSSSSACIVEEFTEEIPTLPIFLVSSTTTNHTASGTERDEKYGDVTVSKNSSVTFSPSGEYDTNNPVMLIKSLEIQDGATVTFSEGDYWIGDWVSYASINIRTTGTVRLFINGNLTLTENHIDFNYDGGNGKAENLFIFVYGNFVYASNGGGDVQNMTAYVYVQGTFTANQNSSNSIFKGAVTSVGSMSLNNNQEYEYDDSGLEDGWGACTSGNVYDNADDLCYTDITYSGNCSGEGEFLGGEGCTQTITIKNLSYSSLKNQNGDIFILDHTGATTTLQNKCGVDGIDYSNGDAIECYEYDKPLNMSAAGEGTFDYYINFYGVSYSSQEEHTIFTKSLVSAPLFSGNNLYAIYQKDGSTYGGQVEDCETTIEFELAGYEISEDIDRLYLKETVNPIIKLNKAVDYDVTVSYYTSDGTAKSGLGDYDSASGSVTIPAGERRATLEIFIYNDQPIEIQENFFVTLKNPSNNVKLGYNEMTTISILEQDDAPTCFEDDFDDLHDDWRVLSATGGFTPGIVSVNGDGRLRVTDGQHNLSTVVTRDVEFESSQNLIIIEFEYYAYGGCESGNNLGDYGADGIVNILFDSTVGDSPTPGGSGGSMGYAQYISNTYGFEGGWLGLGLDEYGNFGRNTEEREGGSTGRIENTAVIRGDGSGMDGYEFLKSVKLTDNGVGELGRAEIAKKDASDYYSGLYKMVVDARDSNHLYINLMRTTTHSENDYATIIDQFDAKDSQYGQGDTPEKIRYAISGGTGEGCNNHELSWIKLRGNCSSYDPSGSYTSGPFASQDTWRKVSEGDFNISTKIVNEPFNIQLLSLDETYKDTELKESGDARWTLKYLNESDNSFLYKGEDGTTYKNVSFDATTYETQTSNDKNMLNDDIVVDKAYKEMYIEITYCAEYNATIKMKKLYPWSMCGEDTSGAISENEEADGRRYYIHEGDHFAVRPSYFQLYPRNSKTDGDTHQGIHAGKDYNLTLCALDGESSNVASCGESISALVLDYSPNLSELTLKKRLLFNDGVEYIETEQYSDKYKYQLEGSLEFTASTLVAMIDGMSRTINDSGNPTGSPRAMGVTFDNVGTVEVGVMDETWAAIDADDSPATCMSESDIDSIQGKLNAGITEPFSRLICMGSSDDNLTLHFIPDHFDVNATLHNHRSGSFTYLASKSSEPKSNPEDGVEPLMSPSIALKIIALNSQGEITTNFTKESTGTYPKETDSTAGNVYYENPISITFDLPTEQHPLAEDNSDYELQKIQYEEKHLMGFDKGEFSIEATEKLLIPYYIRKNNEAVSPFDINASEITLNIESEYSGDAPDINVDIAESSIDFYYARVKPNQDFYEDIIEETVMTPVMITLFCDQTVDPDDNMCAYPAIDPIDGATNERNWYKAKLHRTEKNDGNVSLERGDIMEGSGSPALDARVLIDNKVLNIRSNDGTHYDIFVERGNNPTLPLSVAIELEDVGSPDMSPWLVYGVTLDNDITSDKPEPFYKVRFIDDSSWTGIGQEGSVVDRETSISKTKRMDW